MLILQEIDDPPITENEQIEICKQFNVRIELCHSNVCYGVERDWPRKYFDVADYKSLQSRQQRQIRRTMEKNGVSLYNKYVDSKRREERIKRHNANVIAPFWEERRCRLRFERIKKIAEKERIQVNVSIDQILFEENAQMPEASDRSVDKSPRSDIQNTLLGQRSTRKGRSTDTSRHENDISLKNAATPIRRNTRSTHASTSNQSEESPMSEKTPEGCQWPKRSTQNISKGREKEKSPEILSMTPTRRSTNETPNRPLTRSATKNNPINENITLRRRQGMDRPNDSSYGRDASNRLSLRRRQIVNADLSTDNQQSSRENVHTEMIVTTPTRRSNRIRQYKSSGVETTPSKSHHERSNQRNAEPNLRRTFSSFASNEANQTVINTQSQKLTQKDDFTFSVDTPSFHSPQGGLDSFSQNSGTSTGCGRQPSNHIATNSTPDFIEDEFVLNRPLRNRMYADKNRKSNNNATEQNYSEDFQELNENQTSTQKQL